MFSYNGEPLRIVVETVPHEVVGRLDEEDRRIKARIDGLHNQLYQAIEVVGELRRKLAIIERECEVCGRACQAPPTRKRR